MAKAERTPPTLLMPKATAVWMIENTTLSFKQIAAFTLLTEIEIEALANEEIGYGLVGRDPIEHNELTKEELDRCQADTDAVLKMAKSDLPQVKSRSKGPRYTPVSKRGDKPDAIAYIIKNNTDISDAQICKLIGTTKPTITAIRERTHANMSTLRPRHPAELGLCTYKEFEKADEKGLRAAGKDPEAIKAEKEVALELAQKAEEAEKNENDFGMAGFDFSNFISSTPSSSEINEDEGS